MTQHDPVVASLEHLAEHAGDVSQELLRRFSERCPDSAALMSHMDDHMVGRMMQDVLLLLMASPEEIDAQYLSFEVSSHRAYGVTPDMFPPLLEVVREAVKIRLGERWTADTAAAWADRLNTVTARIEQAAEASMPSH